MSGILRPGALHPDLVGRLAADAAKTAQPVLTMCIRALDYLQSRPEVDGERLGVTGRSGGGAYSWWIAALDERIKVAVPVAGSVIVAQAIPIAFHIAPVLVAKPVAVLVAAVSRRARTVALTAHKQC